MDKFFNKWSGRVVDYDHVFLYQCVDLIKQYWYEVYGVASGAWGNAIDYWTRPNGTMLKYFDKIAGTNAKKGDVVVLWGLAGNPYGHIGIASGKSTPTHVEIWEQNGSSGNGQGQGGDRIRLRMIPRTRIAGLIRRKVAAAPAPVQHIIVKSGWGLSHVAKAAGFKDWWSPARWIAITKLNGKGTNWVAFNRSLKVNQKVRVR